MISESSATSNRSNGDPDDDSAASASSVVDDMLCNEDYIWTDCVNGDNTLCIGTRYPGNY